MKKFIYSIFFTLAFLFTFSQEAEIESLVTASKTEQKLNAVPASVSIVTLKEIEARPTNNVSRLLENIVGVSVDKHGANLYNINLRGANDLFTTSTLIYKDGIQLSGHGLNNFNSENSSLSGLDLARIEVVRGSVGSIYGLGAGSGVVQFISKNPFDFPGTSVQVSSGGLDNEESVIAKGSWDILNVAMRHAVSNDDGTFGYKINARYSENNEFKLTDQAYESLGQSSAIFDPIGFSPTGYDTGGDIIDKAHTFNADATFYWRPSSDLELTAQLGITNSKGLFGTKQRGAGLRNTSDKFLNIKVQKDNFSFAYSTTDSDVPDNVAELGFDYGSGRAYGISSKQSQLQLNYDFSVESLSTLFSVGVESKSTVFNTGGRLFGRFDSGVGVNTVSGSSPGTFQNVFGSGENQYGTEYRSYGTYLRSNTSLSEKLDLVLGGRYDVFSVLEESTFSPLAGLVLKPNDSSSLRLTYNRANIADDAQTLFIDRNFGPTWLVGNSVQQTFSDNPVVNWRIPGYAQLSAANPFHSSGMFLDLDTMYLGAMLGGQFNAFIGTPFQLFLPYLTSSSTFQALAALNPIATPVLNRNQDLDSSDLSKISTETTFEFGYSGKAGKKFSFSVDIYKTRKENFKALQIISPEAGLPNIVAEMQGYLSSVYSADWGPFIGPLLASVVSSTLAPFSLNPQLGVINTEQTPEAWYGGLNWGFKNYGEVEYWGADIAAKYDIHSDLSVFANYSWLDKTYWDELDLGEEIGSGKTFNLNTPKHRIRTGIQYYPSKGFYGGLTIKFDDHIQNSLSGPYSFVSQGSGKKNIVDANIGYKFSQKVSVDVDLQNLTNDRYFTYAPLPEIGFQTMATLTYKF